MPALVHDVCWLVRGVDPLHSHGGGASSGGDIASSGASISGGGGSGVSVSGSSGNVGTDVAATAAATATAAAAASRSRFVCLKDPVDFRSHPVSALVKGIIDRLVGQHTLSIPLLKYHLLTHPVSALVKGIIDRLVE